MLWTRPEERAPLFRLSLPNHLILVRDFYRLWVGGFVGQVPTQFLKAFTLAPRASMDAPCLLISIYP